MAREECALMSQLLWAMNQRPDPPERKVTHVFLTICLQSTVPLFRDALSRSASPETTSSADLFI